MSLRVTFWVVLVCFRNILVQSNINSQDGSALLSLKQLWPKVPSSWNTTDDPCGDQWDGITCRGSRVVSITLSSMGLIGILPDDIQGLSELEILDLSYNKGLSGNLHTAIGNLSKLTKLILAGCSFNGELPDTVGSLSELVFLSVNSNSFSGTIPETIGNLTKLNWLDLSGNRLTGTIPISNGTTPGLDMLVLAEHFDFGRNQLSGEIPPLLFNERMTLLNLLLDNNQFSGTIPTTLALVRTLEVIRFDWNSFDGSVPSNINFLASLTVMLLSNNKLAGAIPDLTGMSLLNYLDVSNNSFEIADVPPWITALPSLTTLINPVYPSMGGTGECSNIAGNKTLIMEQSQIQGTVPSAIFGLPQLQKVVLKNNKLSGIFDIGAVRSSQLQLVDLQNNNISSYSQNPADNSLQIILVENPVCTDVSEQSSYCILPQLNPLYSTPRKCAPVACTSNQASSPNCHCSYPYTGILSFGAPKFSNLQNVTYYQALEQTLLSTFQSNKLLIDSVSLSNIARDPANYLDITLEVFPLAQNQFNRTPIMTIGFLLSSDAFKPPSYYGPFIFRADEYAAFSDASGSGSKSKSLSKILGIIGGSIGGIITMILAYLGATRCNGNTCCNLTVVNNYRNLRDNLHERNLRK